MRKPLYLICLMLPVVFACEENKNFIIFSADDDIALGRQVSEEIIRDPEIKILPSAEFSVFYNYLYTMRDQILNSSELVYAKKFEWNIYIIKNDKVQNAFVTPGGNIFINTGLIQHLAHADELAGVLGHEMAHADQRHTVRNLQRIYGVDILMSVVGGQDASMLKQIAAQVGGKLAGLNFSPEFERQADIESVKHLSHTPYACNGAAYFFSNLSSANKPVPSEFLNAHPSTEARIENINDVASQLGCNTMLGDDSTFALIKGTLIKG